MSLFSRWFQTKVRKQPARVQLCLEHLEGRALPSGVPYPTVGVPWTDQIAFHGHYDSAKMPVASDFQVVIKWGDGSSEVAKAITEPIANSDEFLVTASHTYYMQGNQPDLLEVDITNTRDHLSWVQEGYGMWVAPPAANSVTSTAIKLGIQMDAAVDTITDDLSEITRNLANYFYGAGKMAAQQAWNTALLAEETTAGTALSALANTASTPQQQQLYNDAAQEFFADAAKAANGVQTAAQNLPAALTAAGSTGQQWLNSIRQAIDSGHDAQAFQELGGDVILTAGAVDSVAGVANGLAGLAGPTFKLSAVKNVAQAEQAASNLLTTEYNVSTLESDFGGQMPQSTAFELAENSSYLWGTSSKVPSSLLPPINPWWNLPGGLTNCFQVALAQDDAWATGVSLPVNPGPTVDAGEVMQTLQAKYGSTTGSTRGLSGSALAQRLAENWGIPTPSSEAAIVSTLKSAGNGSRGLVFVQGTGGWHVFNVRNVGGQVEFLDAQVNLPASFTGAQNVYFYMTK